MNLMFPDRLRQPLILAATALFLAPIAQAQRAFNLSITPTNQNNVAVVWKVQSATPIGDLFVLPQYQVQRSPDLMNWSAISGMVTGVLSQTLVFKDPAGTAGFYRVTSAINLAYGQLNNQVFDGGQLQFADFFGAQLFDSSFQNTTLTNAEFGGANLESANLTGADLTGSDLFAVEAFEATFDNGSLAGADASFGDFETASMFNVDLTGADFSSANLNGADLDFVIFKGVKMDANTLIASQPRLVWQVANNGAAGQVLTNQDLSFARIQGVSFNGAILSNTLFTETFLTGDDLRGANFTGADMRLADFTGAQMDGTTVIDAKSRFAWQILNLNAGAGSDLRGTNLSFLFLSGANFQGVNLSNAVCNTSIYEQANFGNANLAKANFSGADFTQAILTNAVLTNANFSTADFTDANLLNSNTNGASFINATFSNTIMPNGTIRNF